jgi:two-component sensor histidine kinase
LHEIAEKYHVNIDELKELANQYETRPSFIIETAKNRLATSAKLIREIVERKLAEEELNKYKEQLEGMVKVRTVELEKEIIERKQASPLGLIINELISNSLKYVFPDERKGEVILSVKNLNKELEITVTDTGVGMPD